MKTIFSTLVFLVTTFTVGAQPGFLDKSFGDTGIALNTNFFCTSIAVQSDQKFLAAGSDNGDVAIVRYFSNGTIDFSFGVNGIAKYEMNLPANAIAVSENGNFVVAAGYEDFILISFKSNGSIDSLFGNNGIVTTDFGANERPGSLALQTDNKILVTGTSINNFSNPVIHLITARYNADGTLDNSFAEKGFVIDQSNLDNSTAAAMTLQADGKIIVGGTAFLGKSDFLLARYNSDGTPDMTFGTNGNVVSSFSNHNDRLFSVAVQNDGKILAGGQANRSLSGIVPANMLLARYTTDGNLDNSFGNKGSTKINFGEDNSEINKILIQVDGKIIVTGDLMNSDQTYQNFALARTTVNGTIDSAFGTNGLQATSIGTYATAKDALILNNKIIVAGQVFADDLYYSAFAAYNDLTQKQIIITKIRRWLQHHHGITWNASNNISSYIVQRSSDGEHWSTVGRPTVNHYNDPSPLNGANYYRLQTTSTDGAVAYSNIIAVANHEIKISPNPASNILHIEGLSSTNKTKITIIDFAGNIKQQAVAGNNACNVNIASLHPGNYLLKIEMNDGVVIKKFVKE
jgi:uncharacterized delta-60 repeat protein